MELQVIDNFLSSYQFTQLQSIMMGEYFPWFYKDYVAYEGRKDNRFQFCHQFLDPDTGNGRSVMYYLMEPFERLGRMYRIKANMRTRTLFHGRSDYHIDYPDMTTAIFYLNTCNGYTNFRKSGKKIKTVANRMVIFDSNLEHAGSTCTDQKIRVLINFNYER